MNPRCREHDEYCLTVVYKRPIRRYFRKTFVIRCWYCNLEIEDP